MYFYLSHLLLSIHTHTHTPLFLCIIYVQRKLSREIMSFLGNFIPPFLSLISIAISVAAILLITIGDNNTRSVSTSNTVLQLVDTRTQGLIGANRWTPIRFNRILLNRSSSSSSSSITLDPLDDSLVWFNNTDDPLQYYTIYFSIQIQLTTSQIQPTQIPLECQALRFYYSVKAEDASGLELAGSLTYNGGGGSDGRFLSKMFTIENPKTLRILFHSYCPYVALHSYPYLSMNENNTFGANATIPHSASLIIRSNIWRRGRPFLLCCAYLLYKNLFV